MSVNTRNLLNIFTVGFLVEIVKDIINFDEPLQKN
jgi:hypothetical protein